MEEAFDSHTTDLVLLVEPDDAIRRSLVDWLRSTLPDCCAAGAASIEQAMALPECKWPSVVVVDIADPDLDGLETIRNVRCAVRYVPVVALTMSDDPEYCDSLACAGASASLLIWRTYCELLATIRRLLSSGQGGQATLSNPL